MAGIQFIYHGPSTPGNTGFSVDLTDLAAQQGIRLGTMAGLQTEAELGAVAQSGIQVDDPTGTAGFGGAIAGLKQLSVNEGRAPSGNRRIGEFYIADRRYYRGGSSSPSLRTAAARLVDITLSDINSFLHFRIVRTGTANGSNTTFNRPAETDVQRVTAVLAIPFIADTLYNGLVSSAAPVNMDAVDYTGQTPGDVLNDCAQQSGKNYFVFYDEAGTYTPAAGQYGLFYDFSSNPVYPAYVPTFAISNVLADVSAGGAGPVWAPLEDAVLTRDPSRVISGVYFANGSNSVYETNPTTSYAFGWRDGVGNSQNLKTVTQTRARAQRYLSENATEDDRLSFSLKLPAAHVNDWREGQYASVKFSHLPGYESFRNVRALTRTVAADEMTDEFYNVHYECSTMTGIPSGAASATVVGVSYSGIPELPRATTPGNVLLAIMFASGNTTKFPTAFRALDSPPVSPASPGVPPFASAAGWTVLETATTDYSGQNIGGPCGMAYAGPFHGGAGVCTSGLFTAAAWRYVQPGEVTTHPAQFSTEITDSQCLTFLWELPTITAPGASTVEGDGTGGGITSTATLPTISGNAIAAVQWATAAGHPARVQPSASSLISGTSLRGPIKTIPGSHAPTNMNDTVVDSNAQQWGWLIKLPSGGVASASITVPGGAPPYNEINWCGVAVTLPPSIDLPDIPYPANQSS